MIIPLTAAQPGDLVFYDSPGDVAWVIKQAQKIAWSGDKNHVAILSHQDSTGQWFIIQAEGCGVTDDKPLVLGANDVIVSIDGIADRAKVLFFAREQVGKHYGFLTDVSIFVTELTPKGVNVMRPNTWICSALAAEALRFGGWYHDWPDERQVAPDPLYLALILPLPKGA